MALPAPEAEPSAALFDRTLPSWARDKGFFTDSNHRPIAERREKLSQYPGLDTRDCRKFVGGREWAGACKATGGRSEPLGRLSLD